ncbi:MAG: hypothetical protein J7L43_01235 [Candidatus Aenigmarchaeota archaeon]|nr:hypothetical protein [Candidatus Aenigmarchaeota archaeon]
MKTKSKIKSGERATYIESVTIVILVILVAISFIFAGYGMNSPAGVSGSTLTNMLLLFLVAEVAVIILMLSRIYHK